MGGPPPYVVQPTLPLSPAPPYSLIQAIDMLARQDVIVELLKRDPDIVHERGRCCALLVNFYLPLDLFLLLVPFNWVDSDCGRQGKTGIPILVVCSVLSAVKNTSDCLVQLTTSKIIFSGFVESPNTARHSSFATSVVSSVRKSGKVIVFGWLVPSSE